MSLPKAAQMLLDPQEMSLELQKDDRPSPQRKILNDSLSRYAFQEHEIFHTCNPEKKLTSSSSRSIDWPSMCQQGVITMSSWSLTRLDELAENAMA